MAVPSCMEGVAGMVGMAKKPTKISYTYTDEGPMVATHAFYPIVTAFCKQANVSMEMKDISLASRVIALFPDRLAPEQREPDALHELGDLARSGQAMIIKLPNISASVAQVKGCIKELQDKGYALPDFPDEPKDDAEKKIKSEYAKVLGSAVNPVLREGNSDRRAAIPVKEFAMKFPHSMGSWEGSKTCVKCMDDGDFYSHEKSVVIDKDCAIRIELVEADGTITMLKDKIPLLAGEVVDATYMSIGSLCRYYEECIQEAQAENVLFSLHLKATMMKISDPVMFGHCINVYFKDVFTKYKDVFERVGVDTSNGLGDVYKKISNIPEKADIEADILATYAKRGKIAMVNSDKGITNLHVPSDVIIDNSIPTAIRAGGMWNADNKLEDYLAAIPDRGYGLVFKEAVDDCKKNGAYDPKTMGCCPNVGLMAQKAEEYGSHPTTFIPDKAGTIRLVVNGSDQILIGHAVQAGDIYRACFVKDAPIRDWVKLAVARCRANNFPDTSKPCKAIFWLDSARTHDVNLITKVQKYLKDHDTKGLDIEIMSCVAAMKVTNARARAGMNTITVTGNVLRDYLTDLYPIMELGSSSKMLSIVPMLAGGAMYETGAGGSAPKHIQQFLEEGHLRWDSLGEYLALSSALEDVGNSGNHKAKALANALSNAIGTFLAAGDKNPSRKVREIDNRGSHYWLARYWADELAKQSIDASMKAKFETISKEFSSKEDTIMKELIDCQGQPQDIGGYYKVDKVKADKAQNPSETLNAIISSMSTAE